VRLTLPSIDRALGLSAAAQTWVANAYMLPFGTLLFFGGRVADLLGRKRTLIAGVGVFTMASLGCGLASSGTALIAPRAVQGVGAAAMTPAALSILMRTFPEGAKRNKAIGAWGATGGLGATAAWLVGGPLIDGPGWQWVFWINVPAGLGLVAVAPWLLGESRDAAATRRFDVAGVLSVTGALVALLYAVVQAPSAGWGSTQTIALAVLSLGLFGAFAAIERRATQPLIPRAIARSRPLLAANVGLAFTAAAIYGMALIVSLCGQEVLHYSALKFGLEAVILPVGAAAGAATSQALATRYGPRAVSAGGIAGLVVGLALLARLPVHATFAIDLAPALLLFGVALGLAATAYSIATLTGVPSRDAGLAAGLNNTFEQIGGALGTAVMATIAAARTSDLLDTGTTPPLALDHGFRLAFAAAIAFRCSAWPSRCCCAARARPSPSKRSSRRPRPPASEAEPGSDPGSPQRSTTMPDTDTHAPSRDLPGIWSGEVPFTAGPRAGDIIHHESWLFAADAILVQLRTRRGVGEWQSEGDRLSFAFYEVILNDAGKPTGVVDITASGTLALDGSAFEVTGRGDVYGLPGELIATNPPAGFGRGRA
jgi:MFS family permease